MITINNKKFAKNEEEFINALFKRGGTCVGYYKPYKKQVKLFDHNHKLVGVINKGGVLGKATEQGDGNYWFSYMDIPLLGEYDRVQVRKDIEVVLYKYLDGIKPYHLRNK